MASSRFLSARMSFWLSAMRGALAMAAGLMRAGPIRAGGSRSASCSAGVDSGTAGRASRAFFSRVACLLAGLEGFLSAPALPCALRAVGLLRASEEGAALRAGVAASACPAPPVLSATPTASAPKRRTDFMKAPVVGPRNRGAPGHPSFGP